MRSGTLLALALSASLWSAEHNPTTAAPVTMALPAQSELTKLADVVSQFAGVSVQYNPQKVTGTVRLAVRGQLTAPELWQVFNQVLVGQQLTTVVSGEPQVYQVVPLNDAGALSGVITSTQLDALAFAPGYAVVVHELTDLSPEVAVKAMGVLFSGQSSQARTLGQDGKRIVLSAPIAKIREALVLLRALDRPGVTPEVRLVRPERATPQALQAATNAAWSAAGRIAGQTRPVDIQVAPDGAQVLLIAAKEDLDALEKMIHDLDRAEPVEARTYRPRSFGVEEVANLLTQVLRPAKVEPGNAGPEVIRDKLTGSLIVKATAAQHRRVEELLRTLDDAPAGARRQVRTFPIRNRQVDELARVLNGLISSGVVAAESGAQPATTTPSVAPPPAAPPGPVADVAKPGSAPDTALPSTPSPATPSVAGNEPPRPAAPAGTTGNVQDAPVVITADAITNRLIALGEPRALDQVAGLIAQLDKRQPQVDLEIILVALSQTQNRDLGIELTGQLSRGSVSSSAASLFGLSQPASAGAPLDRVIPVAGTNALSGFGGVVMNPGDWSTVVRALETVTDGKSLVRSHVVVNNNAKAAVNGVVQEPLTSTNSSNTVATTSVTGTSDAGTQIAITPTISVADYLTIAYTISQSAFIGDAVVIGDTRVPPTKRSDSVASVATIPDGHVIAVGGLTNRNDGTSESRVPWLGTIPGLGWLFKRQTTTASESRFYVFIRASVMRNEAFADLRHASEAPALAAEVDNGWPKLEPVFVK